MILHRSTHPGWLSNSWIVAAGPGRAALVVDAGAPPEPLLAAAARERLEVTHVIATHHHHDHVAHAGAFVERYGSELCAHPQERELVPGCSMSLSDGDTLSIGGMEVRALHVPGHTLGQLNVLVDGSLLFTGDTLFHGSVGGTVAPGHGSFGQLRASILDRLMTLPPETRVLPGHGEETTVGAELEWNPFVRAWRGVDPEGTASCVAMGEPATLLVWARDYDGGHKAWVRFADGREDVVPGSRVDRRGALEPRI